MAENNTPNNQTNDFEDIDVSSIRLDDMSYDGDKSARRSRQFKDLEEKPIVVTREQARRAASSKNPPPLSKAQAKSYYDRYDNSKPMALKVVLIILAAAAVYMLMCVTSASSRRKTEEEISKALLSVAVTSQVDMDGSTDGISVSEKLEQGLVYYLIDSDEDGLSDVYELNVSKTNPLKADTDVDALRDGLEVLLGFDPLNKQSDGVTDDNSVIAERTVTVGNASLTVKDKATSLGFYFDRLDNNSIEGQLGVVGDAYEFYSDSVISGATISFAVTAEDIAAYGVDESALSIVRFDSATQEFIPLEAHLDAENGVITAEVTENGVYSLSNSELIGLDYSTGILFLIDNSGSMYPEELCTGSEENDVDFKRVDFATDFLENFEGDDVSFGAAKFTGTYSTLCSMTTDRDAVADGIETIKDGGEYFNGTEIAGSIIQAVSEFRTDATAKNYIILITDGMPSAINQAREDEVTRLCNENNITVFSVGLGKEVNGEYLRGIADRTDGSYFQAANAAALEGIYEKIQEYMSFNTTVVTDTDINASGDSVEIEKNAYILADTGFDAAKDGMGYTAFPMSEDNRNVYFGIAEFVKRYYSGTLDNSRTSYTTYDGVQVGGYDLSGISELSDNKVDLSSVSIDGLNTYRDYLNSEAKWDFRGVGDDGLLKFNSATLSLLSRSGLGVATLPYDGGIEIKQGFISKITFNEIKPFTSYQTAYIGDGYTGNAGGFFDMIAYYDSARNSSLMTEYDFATNGAEAFEVLSEQMSRGVPAVITFGDKALNAVRLLKETDNPLRYVIEVYDSDYPGEIRKIRLEKVAVHDGGEARFQFAAKYDSESNRLCVYGE